MAITKRSVENQKARLRELKKKAKRGKSRAQRFLDRTSSPSFLKSLITGIDVDSPAANKAEYLKRFEAVRGLNERTISKLLQNASKLPVSTGQNWDKRRDVRIGIVSDTFLYESLEAAATFIPITPESYRAELEKDLDLLLVVSAWRGIDNEWQNVADKRSKQRSLLEQEVIPYAKELGLPVAFYSKEDPPNYNIFLSIAQMADFVFTSAEEVIPKYREALGNDVPIETLAFCVNFEHHNPLGCQRYKGKEVVFAGSWMSHKYPQRAKAAEKIFDAVEKAGRDLVLIDRNLDLDVKEFSNAERYLYPVKYLTNLHAPLPHDQVLRLQKLLPVGINLNSVTTSQTMFANRVVELLATGTLVLSNYSPGINSKYPSVAILDSIRDCEQTLETLTPEHLSYVQVQGIRDVFLRDTCFERIDQILEATGTDRSIEKHKIYLVSSSRESYDAFVSTQETDFDLSWLPESEVSAIEGSEGGDLVVFIDRIPFSDPNLINDIVASMRYSDADQISLLTFDDLEPGFEYFYDGLSSETGHAYWLGYGKQFGQFSPNKGIKVKTHAYSRRSINESSQDTEKDISIIVPVYNNGPHLINKCFQSLHRSSIFKHSEIILVDDGSTSKTTQSIVKMLTDLYPNVTSYLFPEGGSGSASRPRNKGLELTRTPYVTYLDPDNEQTNDAYERLLPLVKKNNRNFVIGNMIRFKEGRSMIQNVKYLKAAFAESEPMNGRNKSILENLNYKPMSIQALIANTEWLKQLNLTQPVGAVGQDSYFFQQMLFYAKNIAVTNIAVHIYYAAVAGSTVNSITPNFYRKYLPLEAARSKWLREVGLIEHYSVHRFKDFLKDWYIEKLKHVAKADRDECLDVIQEIVDLYGDEARNDGDVKDMLKDARDGR